VGVHIKYLQIFQVTNIISLPFLGVRNNGDLGFALQEIFNLLIGLESGIFAIFLGPN
jgi:hypothetical protein